MTPINFTTTQARRRRLFQLICEHRLSFQNKIYLLALIELKGWPKLEPVACYTKRAQSIRKVNFSKLLLP